MLVGVQASRLNVGDILDAGDLTLRLAVGGRTSQERVVSGACGFDPDDPSSSMERGWLMLAGCLQDRDPQALDALVATCLAHEIAALATCAPVPQALRDAAAAGDLVLLEVLEPTRVAHVVAMVQNTARNDDALSFQRLSTLQRFLADALTQDAPAQEIVERLATFIGASVALVSQVGATEQHAGDMTAAAHAGAAAERPVVASPFEVGADHGFVFPLNDCGTPAGWLVVGTSDDAEQHRRSAKEAGKLAVPLLEASFRMRAATTHSEEAVRRATLEELLEGAIVSEQTAAARALSCGVDISDGVAVVTAAVHDVAAFAGEHALATVGSSLTQLRAPWLASARDEHVVVLVGAGDVDAAFATCQGLAAVPAAGSGRVVRTASGVRESYLDALVAMEQAPLGAGSQGVRYEDLELAALLVSEVPVGRLDHKVHQILGPLHDHPMALQTLIAYLENDLDITATARALGLHPNSTRYRLRRVEQLVGAPLRRPSTIVALHLALAAGRRHRLDRADRLPHRDQLATTRTGSHAPTTKSATRAR
ncbi:MAG TPA: helix-turn-helix domain-containing protein [Baekduia sp.]|nr:helix-turn-helix domain-containing protein [Baekduia sp.]